MVIVHGGAASAAHWEPVADVLASRFRVVSMERRLYGRSGPPQSRHTVARAADDVAATIDALGERCVVVGHSSGAVVTLEAARADTPAIAGLVLYEPPLGQGPDETAALRRA